MTSTGFTLPISSISPHPSANMFLKNAGHSVTMDGNGIFPSELKSPPASLKFFLPLSDQFCFYCHLSCMNWGQSELRGGKTGCSASQVKWVRCSRALMCSKIPAAEKPALPPLQWSWLNVLSSGVDILYIPQIMGAFSTALIPPGKIASSPVTQSSCFVPLLKAAEDWDPEQWQQDCWCWKITALGGRNQPGVPCLRGTSRALSLTCHWIPSIKW